MIRETGKKNNNNLKCILEQSKNLSSVYHKMTIPKYIYKN